MSESTSTLVTPVKTSLKFPTAIISKVSPEKIRSIVLGTFLPVVGLAFFLLFWQVGAHHIKTSLGTFPGPKEVVTQWGNLVQEQKDENARAAAFYERQEKRNADALKEDPKADIKVRKYNGRPTFFDKIETSLVTVF
jgi:nitrate/nitrite transport system permease protein